MGSSDDIHAGVQVDVNVSLTAISLLWNAADLLGKGGSAGIEHEAVAGQPPQSPSIAESSDERAERAEALLRQLLRALQVWLEH